MTVRRGLAALLAAVAAAAVIGCGEREETVAGDPVGFELLLVFFQ